MANKGKKITVDSNCIREAYTWRGMSQAELARKLFFAKYYNYDGEKAEQNAISDFNKEFKAELFTPSKLEGMAKILDCDPRYLRGTMKIPFDEYIQKYQEKDTATGWYLSKTTGIDSKGYAIGTYSAYEAEIDESMEISKLKDYIKAIEPYTIVFNPDNSPENPSPIYTLSECFKTITYEELNELLREILLKIAQDVKFQESEEE